MLGVTRRAYNTGVRVYNGFHAQEPAISARVNAYRFKPVCKASVIKEVEKVDGVDIVTERPTTERPVIKVQHVDGKRKIYIQTKGLRAAMQQVARELEREDKLPWVLKVSRELRDNAILDFFKAVDAGVARNTERTVSGEAAVLEEFKYRSRQDRVHSMAINMRTWNAPGAQVSMFFKGFKTKKESLPATATAAVRVQVTREGLVSLHFMTEAAGKDENQAPSRDGVFHSTASLDPGVRTFQAIYDADGYGIEWGAKDMSTILYMCRTADKIQSKIATKKGNRSGLRRAFARQQRRLRNKVKECHNKLALFLCENYRLVLIPAFEVSRMVLRANRKINSKTVRGMCTWSHFKFREALKSKAELYPWCRVVEVGEAYTSKTCEECGDIHHKLGTSKVFKCPSCKYTADRDLHAAKNILLRYLTLEGFVNNNP